MLRSQFRGTGVCLRPATSTLSDGSNMDDNLNNTQSSREKPVYDPFARWLSRDHLDAPGITETPQLDLDQRSLEHLCNWAEQLCNNSGLKPLWIVRVLPAQMCKTPSNNVSQGLLQAVIPDIGALVTCDTLDALTKTRHALHEASELAEVSSQKSDATVEPLESTARRLIAESQHTSLPKLTRFNLCFHFTPLATPAASRSIILQPGLQSGVILGHETKAPPTSNDWDDIGGTFLVSGSARERDRVQSILSLLAFGTFHSILENRFYHDLGLDRRQPKPEPELPPDPPEKDTHIEVPPPIEDPTPVLAHEEIYLPASQPSSGRRWPNALWNFISGKTTSPGSSRPASPTPGPSSLSASSPKNPGNKPLSLPMKLKPRLKRKSRPQPASMGSNATIRSRVPQLDAWEILAPGPDTLQSYSNPDIEISPIPSPSLSTTELVEEPVEEPQPASANRFTQLADRINKTILSVSPDVSTFPPPQILLHLRDEEDAKGQHQKISVDARAGLASLVPNNTSLDGAIYHQSILFLRERCNLFAKPSEPPCDKLTWSSIRYYDFASDEKDNSFNDDILSTGKDFRLGDLIQGFINGQTHKCATEGCDRTVSEHALYLTHNTTRCSISLRKKAPRREPGVIWAWCKCNCCGEVSRPVKPSAYSLSMSTG